MDAKMKTRRELEMDLRNALVNAEFELYYQPLVNLKTNEISAFEALVRWNHPDARAGLAGRLHPGGRGDRPHHPARRMGAEKGLPGDRQVAGAYQGRRQPVAVPAQEPQPAQLVVSALAESGMPASRLQLEITETVLMHNTFNTLATLHALRKLGVQIAMDDFGTGYSSLSYLRSFPFDKIKIDRSFIQDLSNGAEPLAIVHASQASPEAST